MKQRDRKGGKISLYSARRSVSLDKTRGWYLGDTWITWQTALLNCARVGKGGREGIPMDDSSGKEYEPVVVFESLDLSVCQ